MELEFGSDGVMRWRRVEPPEWWPAAGRYILADRHLSDGTRQHMVHGSVPAGTVVANAQVIGEDDAVAWEFAKEVSPLGG